MNARHLERGWVRDVPGEFTSGGHPLVVHLAGPHDVSPAWSMYPTGYDSRCGWCWLNAPHSSLAHAASIARRMD